MEVYLLCLQYLLELLIITIMHLLIFFQIILETIFCITQFRKLKRIIALFSGSLFLYEDKRILTSICFTLYGACAFPLIMFIPLLVVTKEKEQNFIIIS